MREIGCTRGEANLSRKEARIHLGTFAINTQKVRTLKGSNGSGGGGLEFVLTAQNMHPLVQVSPKSIMVPVPPLQHSPILGH